MDIIFKKDVDGNFCLNVRDILVYLLIKFVNTCGFSFIGSSHFQIGENGTYYESCKTLLLSVFPGHESCDARSIKHQVTIFCVIINYLLGKKCFSILGYEIGALKYT